VVAFLRHTLLPLDGCHYALQTTIPRLTRSALHRCLQRHGLSRLPDVAGDKPKRQKFKRYPIGFFHIVDVQTDEGKLYLFVGIDRTSKFAVTHLLVDKADRKTAREFLQQELEAVPYRVRTILTDHGIQFAEQSRNRSTAYSWQMVSRRCPRRRTNHGPHLMARSSIIPRIVARRYSSATLPTATRRCW